MTSRYAVAVAAIRAGRCPACGGELVPGVRFGACACGQEWLVHEDGNGTVIVQPRALWVRFSDEVRGYVVVAESGPGMAVEQIDRLPAWATA